MIFLEQLRTNRAMIHPDHARCALLKRKQRVFRFCFACVFSKGSRRSEQQNWSQEQAFKCKRKQAVSRRRWGRHVGSATHGTRYDEWRGHGCRRNVKKIAQPGTCAHTYGSKISGLECDRKTVQYPPYGARVLVTSNVAFLAPVTQHAVQTWFTSVLPFGQDRL